MESNKLLKSLGIGIIVFMALNFILQLVSAAVDGNLTPWFESLDNAYSILYALFGYVVNTPTIAILNAGVPSIAPLEILAYVVFPIMAAVIAAIITGRFAEEKSTAFVAWFFVALISGIILFIGVIIEIEGDFSVLSNMDYIMFLGFPMIVGFAYSFIAIFSSETSVF
ncbi:MAG: hypothetical protein KGD63_00535 [Candidatus Lokiarchaeota archaeon]|nr:hypothetical protein [Candidatus Lokiarchaeota archaeon]